MIKGKCHCGAVRWTLKEKPERAKACSCTVCRRYGALWAYGYEGEDIDVAGETKLHVPDDSLSFNFCPGCGCITYWRSLKPNDEGRWRIAVNLRMAEPGSVADIPVHHFDGLDTWSSMPDDGRCVKDLWF